jgi:hypothetical protein
MPISGDVMPVLGGPNSTGLARLRPTQTILTTLPGRAVSTTDRGKDRPRHAPARSREEPGALVLCRDRTCLLPLVPCAARPHAWD